MLKALKRIIAWTGPYRRNLYLGCVCSFFMTWATAAPVMLAAWMLAQVVDDARGVSTLDPSAVWLSLAAIVACIAARFAFSYGKNRLQESIGYEVAPEVRIRIGTILKRVPLGYFSRMKTGDILATTTTELGMLELNGMKMIDAVVNGYVSVAAVIAFLAVMDWRCALAALAGVGLSALALAGINRRSRKLTPATHEASERLSGAIVEFARGLGTAKSYGRGSSALQPMYAACAQAKKARVDVEFGFTPFNVAHLVALKLASVALVGFAAWACLGGTLPLWMFLAIALLSFTIFGGVEGVADSAHMLGDLNDVLDRLDKIEQARFIDEDGRALDLDRFDIAFEDVAFSYDEGPEARTVLHDVSFAIPEGTTCAIVGPSGSGKTTIANLMARFWDVSAGSVRVGGHDVREFTCDSLLANFSMVFQNVYLFNDTVEANIAFGCPGASHDEVVAAAKRACCHGFIEELPQGYDTVVGEGGSSLSGGQKQRISIARALLKDAPIVVLDEATASVDPENEQLIQQAIGQLTAGKTVVVIAHRLATVEASDQILVVDGGTVAQRGTHDLMARFWDVSAGSVRVGGHDVREFTCDSLLANFSMVFQNVYLFNDTVEANIAFGCPGASHDEVVAAAKRACCHGFIEELPQGYDTVVGEGGSSLSGGQKQRISIARALLKDAPIVVLDEATASVDPENEQLIQQAIGQLTAGKTVVVIAHRLATVEASDQILVVDGGTVAQRGTHDQLMAEGGTYRRFVEIRRRAEGWRIASDDAVAPAPAEDAPMPAAS